jgi:mRNA interferase MazF
MTVSLKLRRAYLEQSPEYVRNQTNPRRAPAVLIPNPNSARQQLSPTPAVAIGFCQITSKPYGDACAIRLAGESFKKGSLRVESFVRPGKLFTASVNLFLTEVGSLKQSSIQQILKGIADLFRPPGELEERVPQSAQKVEALVRAKEFSTMTKSTKPFWLCCISASMRESAHGKALIG